MPRQPCLPPRRARSRAALLAAALLAPAIAGAQQAAAAHPVEGPSFVPMALALLFILGLMGAALWVLRRAGLAPRAGTGGAMKIVGQLALGPRERVLILEVGERWLLLGVGSNGISRLGTLPKGQADAAAAAPPAFGRMLEMLRKGSGQ